MASPVLICLVAPGHIGSTPRLVKEADALAEAGYRVHVVSGRHFDPARALDESILSRGRWHHTAVDYAGGLPVARKLARELARRYVALNSSAGVHAVARAQHSEVFRLARAATQTGAGYFIGHSLAGLAAAAFAADRGGTGFGFDIEDLHEAETEGGAGVARALQAALLPHARHLTASSPLIADEVRRRYGCTPSVILNVFPLAEAPPARGASGPFTPRRPAHLYWFSQTVSPGRGLEEIVRVLGRMRTPAVLQLRGVVAPGYAAALQDLAARNSVRPVEFLPTAFPDQMARLAGEADLGLSLEEREPLNRDLCLTNKVFTYLLAGIPQLLSDTRAQRAIAGDLGAAALLAATGDTVGTAALLDALLGDPARMAAAREAARAAARNRFCWDREKDGFVSAVRTALARAGA